MKEATEVTKEHENEVPQTHFVTITVNEQPVQVPAPKTTGLEIKESAILVGVSIQLDFVLSEERPNGDTEIIGDFDIVTVHPHSKFIALAPDDNS